MRRNEMTAPERASDLDAETSSETMATAGHLDVSGRLEKVFDELAEIRSLMNNIEDVAPAVDRDGDLDALWSGLEAIQQAINKTRFEIGALHAKGLRDRQINRATDELDAVVSDTEHATQSILAAAEAIDGASDLLMTRLDGNDRARAAEIHDHVIHIFEACNFQDIAGQRLTKVVSLLHFIETSVGKMAEIWVDSGRSTVTEESEAPAEKDALLNGPALAGDEGIVSQDDIDSLFN
jgi:chemotaxis protein CheZ